MIGGAYQFVRRIPTDLSDHYRSSRIQISLRTRNPSEANRCALSITRRLEDYWLGLRLEKFNIPAMPLVCTDINNTDNGFKSSDAHDLYLKLKGKDKAFIRTAHENTEYVIRVLDNKSVTAYSSPKATQFHDWFIKRVRTLSKECSSVSDLSLI